MKIEARYPIAAVTICATNFINKALALRESYIAFNPESDFYILVIEPKSQELLNLGGNVKILWAEDLDIPEFLHYAFKFDIIELSTNVKAATLSLLLSHYNKVLYLDPDIYFYSDIQNILGDLETNPILVTPHTLVPILDGRNPSDLDFLRFGSFNLGFVAVKKSAESFEFLKWWSERCLKYGYYEPQLGLAVDQKWLDLAPAFFQGLKILRDPGSNVAFWNLHERHITKRDNTWFINEEWPLRFFHFSSFNPDSPQSIAYKQCRFAPGSRPDLHELLENYALAIQQDRVGTALRINYYFDYFEDGIYISPSLRRFYASLESRFPKENPFRSGSIVQKFALKHRLAGKWCHAATRSTFRDMRAHSSAARMISFGLRVMLRVLGPNRYFVLMKYLAYISSIRNQHDVFPAND